MSAGTQRKCFMASACFHAVLLGVLLVAPAFLTSKPRPVKPGANLVSAAAVEAVLRGGTPAAAPAPPPQPEPVVTPQPPAAEPTPRPPEPVRPPPPVVKAAEPRPVEPPPKKVEPVKKSEPVKTAPPKATAKAEPKAEPKAAPKAETKQYALKRVTPSSATTSSSASKSPQPSLKDDVQKSLERIGKPGPPVRITTPGGASAGAAGDQYALLVRETYDKAWVDPSEVADSGAEVEVHVTIARNGEILSAKVVSRSGIGALDVSVQKALDRVRRIPQGMPPSMPDKQKTYVISFNLRDRR